MIVILTNDGDVSSDIVIDWLKYFNHPFTRINTSDLLDHKLRIDITPKASASIKIDDNHFYVKTIGAVWYRKFGFFRRTIQAKIIEEYTNAYTVGHLSAEFSKVMNTIVDLFDHCYWLTDPRKINLTKPAVLRLAEKHGFKIPTTCIVNNKVDLVEIGDKSKIISKSIYDPMSVVHDHKKFLMFTKEIKSAIYPSLPELFLPSMVQGFVDKKYEIRTFFLEGKCYSMTIHSQQDSQTQIDYRKYNIKKPNRCVPIRLPEKIEKQIIGLMKDLGLNTGSLDFIVQPNNNIVFLEVNPTGQFGMVDFPCNYGLHRKIAELLIRKDLQYGKTNFKGR